MYRQIALFRAFSPTPGPWLEKSDFSSKGAWQRVNSTHRGERMKAENRGRCWNVWPRPLAVNIFPISMHPAACRSCARRSPAVPAGIIPWRNGPTPCNISPVKRPRSHPRRRRGHFYTVTAFPIKNSRVTQPYGSGDTAYFYGFTTQSPRNKAGGRCRRRPYKGCTASPSGYIGGSSLSLNSHMIRNGGFIPCCIYREPLLPCESSMHTAPVS